MTALQGTPGVAQIATTPGPMMAVGLGSTGLSGMGGKMPSADPRSTNPEVAFVQAMIRTTAWRS